jgi:hypothetical protein
MRHTRLDHQARIRDGAGDVAIVALFDTLVIAAVGNGDRCLNRLEPFVGDVRRGRPQEYCQIYANKIVKEDFERDARKPDGKKKVAQAQAILLNEMKDIEKQCTASLKGMAEIDKAISLDID